MRYKLVVVGFIVLFPAFVEAVIISGPTLSVLLMPGQVIRGTKIIAGPTLYVNVPTNSYGSGSGGSGGGASPPLSSAESFDGEDSNSNTSTTTTSVAVEEEQERPNEPGGFNLVSNRHFDLKEEAEWSANEDEEFMIVEDTNAPSSPPNIGQALFPQGWIGGYAPVATQIDIEDESLRRLYISFWLKISEKWQSHPIVNKISYVWIHDKPVVMITFVPQDGKLYPQVRVQETPDGREGAINFELNRSQVEVQRDKWQHWEVLLVANTGSESNGEVHWWLDGTKVGEHTGIRYSVNDNTWEEVSWRPIWGGLGSEVQRDQYMWMDEYYISGVQ